MNRHSAKHRIRSILPLLLFSPLCYGVLAQETGSNPITVEYCALVENPEKYDGIEVTVRATYRYGFEWQEIFCVDCRDKGKTWLEIDDDLAPESIKILKRLPKDDGTVNALFTGIFQSSKGPYGANGYRFGFILKRITQVVFVSKNGGDPDQLPADARRKVCGAFTAPLKPND